MTSFGPTINEIPTASKEATDPAQGDPTARPAADTSSPSDANLTSASEVEAPAASQTSTPRTTPARKANAVATQKTASPRKNAPAKEKALAKATVEAVAPQRAAPAKKSPVRKAPVRKASAKKVAAKKAGPLKRETMNRVETAVPVSKPVAPATVTKRPVKVSAPEAARDAGKVRSKLVRDSFTMPQQDFDLIAALKARALNFKRPAKKSELLRAGLQALQQLSDGKLRAALDSLVPLKAGRPKKRAN